MTAAVAAEAARAIRVLAQSYAGEARWWRDRIGRDPQAAELADRRDAVAAALREAALRTEAG